MEELTITVTIKGNTKKYNENDIAFLQREIDEAIVKGLNVIKQIKKFD